MGSDPRTEAAAKAIHALYCTESPSPCKVGPELQSWEDARAAVAAADAYDRDRGVVRVDTRDEATVERVAQTILACDPLLRADASGVAAAVLRALTQEDNR